MFIFKDRSNQEIWNFQNSLVSMRPFFAQRFKSKFESCFFLVEPEGNQGVVSEDVVKNQISQQEFKWASLGIHWN